MDKKVFKVLLGIMIIYFLFGQICLPRESEPVIGDAELLQIDWEWVHEDGVREEITIPGSYSVPKGDVMTVEGRLPEGVEQNTYLRFYSLRQDMNIYIDGELRKSYSTKDTRLFGLTSSAYYIMLELSSEDSGKPITVEYMTDSSYSGELRAIYYGDKLDLWGITFQENGVEMLVALFTLLCGLASIICSFVLQATYKRPVIMEYLGWSVTLCSAWIIDNSMFRQLLFPNLSTVSDLTFLTVMVLPLPFLIYFNGIQKARYQKWYSAMETIVVISVVICVGMHITGIMDFSSSLIYTTIICIFVILIAVVTMILDVKTGYIKNYKYSAIGICGAAFAVILQFALYYLQRDVPFSGAILSFGLIFLLIISGYNTVKDMLYLEKEKQRAISESEARARFLANMSHEIRTPINAILGMDEMILRESQEPNVVEYAQDIQNAGRSLLSLINDILDFSKMEAGHVEIVPVEYSMSSLLNDCYSMVVMRAEEKGLFLEVDTDAELPSMLFGDELRVKQIIINLLTNAVKYTKEGSVRLTVKFEPKEEDIVWLDIIVSDTGMGISEEDQQQLFDAFQRVDILKNRNVEGTGLGLPLTKQLVELMEGTITVNSEVNVGSTFSIRIPQKVVSDKPMGDFVGNYDHDVKISGYRHSFYAPKGRILVVDDVLMNLKVFTGLLKGTGLYIDVAESGERCLQLVRKNQYDIIFLDHMMPEMDGVETLRQMKELMEYIDTPVIMLTANAMVGAKDDYLSEGFHDYMTKPIQGSKLEKMIVKYLPKQKLEEKPKQAEPVVKTTEKTSEKADEKKSLVAELHYLDTKLGLSYCGGDERMYTEMVTMYAQSNQDELLEEYYQKQDWHNYGIKVHSLKSTSLGIGAVEISEQAKKLEAAVNEGDIAYVEEQHPIFMEDYKGLLEWLRSLL